MTRELLLYSRPGCHLCEEAGEALLGLCRGYDVRLRLVDVDDDPRWQAAYGLRIPVVTCGGQEITAWPLDTDAVRAWLNQPA
jgi:hypothetical protein